MDHRERILAAIRGEPVDRFPTDVWAIEEVQEKLIAHFQIDSGLDTPSEGVNLLGRALTRGAQAILEVFDKLDVVCDHRLSSRRWRCTPTVAYFCRNGHPGLEPDPMALRGAAINTLRTQVRRARLAR